MSINQRAKDMWVSYLVEMLEKRRRDIRQLEEENARLRDRIITDENFEDKLAEENKKLKEELDQIKEAYIRFEKVDSEFQKWLWELDQLIMNR